ncbi:N-acetyltransferase [Streptomyces yaizuensis]|uniref:N-acetyltransferase n=1 Tax=Streptomyces yaizuensis TaxID=2989713 RepID=A0ABQ5P2S9_9ACTN|nr:N-acetyltransferase [Streptomyces sp. YSPA8]GLF96901.1 N-acetyltransferase [Streptomyces sp. YSPA8]
MSLTVTTLAERPGLLEPLWAMPDTWPAFMEEDPVGWACFGRIPAEFPEYVLIATDDGSGEVVARSFSVPFRLAGEDRGELPDRGWDQVLLWAFSDLRHGVRPDTVSAIDITVRSGRQGEGLSGLMLAALRENVRRLGIGGLVAPVRPNAKHREPRADIHEYAFRTRPDGLPHDPWLRVHARAGGVVERVAPVSMTIAGSLAQWRSWTGLPFAEAGTVEVPGALVPVRCEPEADHAVYVEPNVWVRHTV